MSTKPVSLDTLLNGEIVSQFQNAHEEVLENIMDISTDWKYKRKITIELVYDCRDENREQVLIAAQVKTKTEGQKPAGGVLSIGREKIQGEVKPVAYTMTGGNKNQTTLFPKESE